MAMTFLLVEASAYRVRYLATTDTVDPTPVVGFILNRAPPDINLRTDTGGAFNNSPINQLVATPITVGSNPAARRLLFGDGLTSRINLEVPRAHTRLTPKTVSEASLYQWNVDAIEGSNVPDAASTGFACLMVQGPLDARCYVDVYYEHTFQR